MCAQVTHKHLLTVHQEMAHIQYFLHYREQPKIYRDGANTGKFFFINTLNLTCETFDYQPKP